MVSRAVTNQTQFITRSASIAGIIVVLSAVAFVAAVTYGTFQLFAWEDVGVFYDYQAKSLLQGHWDVPDQAIHDEAFVVDGKSYGYFGPTPAVLRMPVMLFDPPVGHLARVFMLAYFVGALVAAYALLCEANRLTARGLTPPDTAVTTSTNEPGAWATAVLLLSTGLGSPMLFLAGRPMMYTEAIACGAVFALWSAWCSFRWLRAPERRWWVGALGCGVLSVQSRPTSGFFALTLLGLTSVWLGMRGWHLRRRQLRGSGMNRPDVDGAVSGAAISLRLARVAALSVLGVLSVNAVAYLKFGTFDSAPLELSRPYLGNDRYPRVENKKFHLENLRWGFDCYFVAADLKFENRFPFFGIGYRNSATDHPEAKIDLPDFTVAAPFAMPALVALAVFGSAVAFVRTPPARAPLTLAWIAGLPMAVVLCGFIAVAQRYLADFCPWLICGAAFGAAALAGGCGWRWQAARAALALVAVASVMVSAALLFDYQCNWGPLPPDVRQRYQAIRDGLTELIRQ